MALPLLHLPQELLVRVASFLTTPELGKLRGTCKGIESNLFESFAYEFFHKRQFMLEEPSLQALVDISRHPTLSKRLTEVIISNEFYLDANDATSIIGQQLLLGGYASRDTLISSGRAKDMLAEAFDNLPNLRRVGLRDYNAKGRYRDGDNAQWRSYGWSLADGLLCRPASSADPFTVLLSALGSCSAHVVNVEVFLRHRPGLSDGAFDILSERTQNTVGRAISRLKVLMLSLESEVVAVGDRSNNSPSNIRLKKFFHHTSELEHLRLNFNERDKRPPELLDWLALARTASVVTSKFDYQSAIAPLPHLTNLELGMASVRPELLIKILTRFELKSCTLWKINLTTGRDIDLTLDPTTNPAQKFFSKLATAMKGSSLHRAKVGFMTIDGVRADRFNRTYAVDFPTSRDNYQKVGDSEQQVVSKPVRRQVYFGGGAAATFADWARDLAGRATCLRYNSPARDCYVDASNLREDPASDESDESDGDEEMDDDEEDEEDED